MDEIKLDRELERDEFGGGLNIGMRCMICQMLNKTSEIVFNKKGKNGMRKKKKYS